MISTAIILSGGKGERMRPYTDDKPKSMILINGHPAVLRQLLQLKNYGVTEIIFACGYKKEALKNFFKDGSEWGINIHYSEEDTPLGRGGAIKQAMKQIKNSGDNVLVTNGDNLWKLDINELVTTHESLNPLVTVVVVPLKSPYGIVDIDDENQVLGFREKPFLPFWVNAGVYVLARKILERLPDIGDHEDSTFPSLAKDEFVAYKSTKYWKGFDTVKDLNEAEKEAEIEFADLFMGQRIMESK